MSKTGSANGSFFGNFIYDQLLHRRPHFLSDHSKAADFSFVKAALKDFYADWGRAPWDPVLMFKMVFLFAGCRPVFRVGLAYPYRIASLIMG